MRFHSIKYKVTGWYTAIILVVFAAVMAGTFLYSEYYGEAAIREELLDEVKDLQEDFRRYPKLAGESLASYYDDGVMLSIYDEELQFINGILPDEFPSGVEFEDNGVQLAEAEDDTWMVNDRRMELEDGTVIWIRGVHSYSSVVVMMQRMILMVSLLFPALLVLVAFVGYRMIGRSLRPIQSITATANEIADSAVPDDRIPLPKVRDEFYNLSVTFNRMFDSLERNFQREKQFSSDAAHELRTPVSVVLSHCEYCLEELELSREAEEEILLIQRTAQRMSELVSSLLAISRQEKRFSNRETEDVDLKILAETVKEELEERAREKQISIEIINRLENPVIRGDMSMLTRVFINLMENAVAYGREQGWIRVVMERDRDEVKLIFQDNGIGIPEESQDKIWNRFYRVDESHSGEQGFGLGLYLVKQIVEAHRGRITVESTPGQGSTFTVWLPEE